MTNKKIIKTLIRTLGNLGYYDGQQRQMCLKELEEIKKIAFNVGCPSHCK